MELKTGWYRHIKTDTLYFAIGEGIHTETEERLVFYMDEDNKYFVRPFEMFLDGRFKYVNEVS